MYSSRIRNLATGVRDALRAEGVEATGGHASI